MTSTVEITPEAAASLRSLAVGKLKLALSRAVNSFEATPDDKFDFKPSETANSPRQLLEHMISGNGYVGRNFGIEPCSSEVPTDRVALLNQLKDTTEAIIAKIETLSDESVASDVDFFGHPMPMADFILVDEWHIARHVGQLDYIQTIYGDMVDHG